MEKKHVTIKDIANECQVSIATVSRVLNKNYYVTPEIRNRVLEAVERLEYSPNLTARSLKNNHSGIIGYITGDFSNNFHITIAHAIESVVQPAGYNLIVASSAGKKAVEEKQLQSLISHGIDALAINPTCKNDEMIAELSHDIPVVLINRRIDAPAFRGDLIDLGNEAGMYELTKELTNAGHKRILIAEGPMFLSNTQERFAGYKKALNEAGIELNEKLYRYSESFLIECGVNAVRYALGIPKALRPTAYVGANNSITVGLMKAFHQNNIRVPEDVSLAGFNRVVHADIMKYRPTMASFDPTDLGIAAGHALLERIENHDIENRDFIFSPEIIKGNSIAAPKA